VFVLTTDAFIIVVVVVVDVAATWFSKFIFGDVDVEEICGCDCGGVVVFDGDDFVIFMMTFVYIFIF
jgi:hypothetical protein